MLRLYYYKADEGNFGDDLNVWLWPRLLDGVVDVDDPVLVAPGGGSDADPDRPLLVGVGTVLNEWVPPSPHKVVLGSGTGYGPPAQLDDSWTVLAIRGPKTAEVVGASTTRYGDPALLVPGVWGDAPTTRSGAVFVPHHGRIGSAPWAPVCRAAGMRYVDPRRSVDDVVGAIASSELVVAESLHAAIVADAFRVPWVPVQFSKRVLTFKWEDWCESVGLTYEPGIGPPLQLPSTLKMRTRNLTRIPEVVRFLRHQRQKVRPQLSDEGVLRGRVEGLLEAVEEARSWR